MNETAEGRGVQLDAPGAGDSVVAFPDELFSHLHFDRRARTWRGPDEIVSATQDSVPQDGTLRLRCA
ncbi:MAG TPA: hypothetical protein VG520_06665 [Candidatus Dormibacteraeota bacterium]|jgi:hypothetical protein|nr:hypothetical protein [Candidatus Dormibacteraeota bacterium]